MKVVLPNVKPLSVYSRLVFKWLHIYFGFVMLCDEIAVIWYIFVGIY